MNENLVIEAFKKVEQISGRLDIQAILIHLMRHILSIRTEDVFLITYIWLNKLETLHNGIEVGIRERILLEAVVQVTGLNV